jgi:primary-amine oxidase
VICLHRANNATYKSVVSMTDNRIESFEHIPGVQANFTVDEFVECDRLLRKHPDVIAALANRGITDMDLVFMDTWTYSDAVAPSEFRDRRIGWSDTWLKGAPGANPYAHPVSGLHCVVDLNSMELLRIEDNGGVEPPDVMGEYLPHLIPSTSAQRRDARRSSHCTSASRRGRPSPSTATRCSGRTGRCESVSTTGKA